MRLLIHRDALTTRHRTPADFDAAGHFDAQVVLDPKGFHVYEFVDGERKLSMPGKNGRVCVHGYDIVFALTDAVSRCHLDGDLPTIVITKLPPSNRCVPTRARGAIPTLEQDLLIRDTEPKLWIHDGFFGVDTYIWNTRVVCCPHNLGSAIVVDLNEQKPVVG